MAVLHKNFKESMWKYEKNVISKNNQKSLQKMQKWVKMGKNAKTGKSHTHTKRPKKPETKKTEQKKLKKMRNSGFFLKKMRKNGVNPRLYQNLS